MRLSLIRGGLHVSGHSDGSSLVVLPLQFSHCLRARDERVRLVRANLMMTGMFFSRDIDTDIRFDYGIFSPGCRSADLADMRQLDLRINVPMQRVTGDQIGRVRWQRSQPRQAPSSEETKALLRHGERSGADLPK
jgi:hypothetical protein